MAVAAVKPEMTEEIRDAFVEVFNIGVGRAASVLSTLAGAEVVLSVPELRIVRRDQLGQSIQIGADGRITGVRQVFSGAFDGTSVLLFPEAESLSLARSVVPDPDRIDDMTEMEREALLEIGNIVLNACISVLADLLSLELETDVPELFRGDRQDLSGFVVDGGDCDLMVLRIEFRVRDTALAGHIVFVLDLRAWDALRLAIEAVLKAMRR